MDLKEALTKVRRKDGNQYNCETWDIAHKIILEDKREYIKGQGRGIVTCAGGKYFLSGYLLCRWLKELCHLPIEFWIITEDEINQKQKEIISNLATLRICPKMHGWTSKIYAIMNSSFEHILWLDADNIPQKDVTYLFDYGSILWPDLTNNFYISQKAIDLLNVEKGRLLESGQILINKKEYWGELSITMNMCDYPNYWYKLFFGDHSALALSFWKTKKEVNIAKDTNYIGNENVGALIHYDLKGDVIFHHKVRPTCKWKLENNLKYNGEWTYSIYEEYLRELK